MKSRVLVLLLAIGALIAKIYCAATTIGSSDVMFFHQFAQTIHAKGLIAMYQSTQFFNHTPLVGWFSEGAYVLSGSAEHPGLDRDSLQLFAFYLRLPAIFADFFAVIALLWLQEKTGRPSWWALAIFAASPVAFMVSGYHGNVDPLMALGVLLAGIACAVDRPALCGVCLGLACNIKIIPLILVPAFFFLWWQRRQAVRFTIPAVLTTLVGWSYPLLTIPGVFLKDVLGYGSIWGVWGITYFLRLTDAANLRDIAFTETTPAQNHIMTALKAIIVVSALVIAWRRRKATSVEIFRTLTLIWAVFFVFAPGFGAQYLAWLMPCFLVASDRWFAWLTATSSVALFVFYNAISHADVAAPKSPNPGQAFTVFVNQLQHGLPWHHGFTVHSIAAQWTWALVLPWLTLAAFLAWQLRFAFGKAEVRLDVRTAAPVV
jgi:uncharacterized membrane protein